MSVKKNKKTLLSCPKIEHGESELLFSERISFNFSNVNLLGAVFLTNPMIKASAQLFTNFPLKTYF